VKRLKLLKGIGLISLLFFSAFGIYIYISAHFIHHLEEEDKRINIVDKQKFLLRSITYRIRHIISLEGSPEMERDIQDIEEIIAQYEQNLYDLRYGNPQKALKGMPEHNRETLKRLSSLSEAWSNEQKPVLLKILKDKKGSCNPCHFLLKKGLNELDQLSLDLQKEREGDIHVHDRERLFILIILLLLFLLVLFYSKKRIIEPLLKIRDSTHLISEGFFDINISENKAPDEIKELALAINTMAESLKNIFEENIKQAEHLKIIADLSKAVNRSLSLRTVCSEALNIILSLKELSIEKKGAIFVAEDGQRLSLLCHTGFTTEFARAESEIPFGECLCGASARDGELIISESALNDKRHSRNYPGMVDHGHIILPIKAGEKTTGVLCLYLPPGYKPAREEISLLTSITDVLGVAMENARNFERLEELTMELKVHEERLRATLNTVPDCIKIIDREGILVDINPAGLEILKASAREEVLGRSIFLMVEPEYHDELRSVIQRAFNQDIAGYIHLRIRDLKDEVHYIEGRYTPLKNSRGETIAVLSISRDLTEYKKLESQLYHSQKMEAIGRLAGGIAHDFNNMLNAILGFGSLIDMQMKDDDPNKLYLKEILKAGEKAAHLTRSLLTFSRKEHIKPELLDLNEIIKDLLKILKRVIGEDIILKIDLSNEPIHVMADSGQIEQVLMNLATNARDAMPYGGTIEIKTLITEMDERFIKTHGYGRPGRYGTIVFSDKGTGMDKKTLSRIFEPYFTTKEFGKGTGLGLAIVYGIVKQHNGYIDVWSELNKGTVFTIYFPLSEGEIRNNTEVKDMPLGKGELVLIAEDADEVRKAINAILTGFGYRVIEAKNGREAIEIFRKSPDEIDALLFDVVMPEKNGIEALEEIKKIKPDIKALLMSGYTGEVISNRIIEEKNLPIIQKPLKTEELLRSLRELLDN